jgi:hypothetical protein
VVAVPALVAELLVVAVVVREAAVPSSPRWSRWPACRGGRGPEARPRWWCWSPIAAVALVVVVAELAVTGVPGSSAVAMLVVRGWRRWRGSTSTRWLDVAHDLLAERAGCSRIAAPPGGLPLEGGGGAGVRS